MGRLWLLSVHQLLKSWRDFADAQSQIMFNIQSISMFRFCTLIALNAASQSHVVANGINCLITNADTIE